MPLAIDMAPSLSQLLIANYIIFKALLLPIASPIFSIPSGFMLQFVKFRCINFQFPLKATGMFSVPFGPIGLWLMFNIYNTAFCYIVAHIYKAPLNSMPLREISNFLIYHWGSLLIARKFDIIIAPRSPNELSDRPRSVTAECIITYIKFSICLYPKSLLDIFKLASERFSFSPAVISFNPWGPSEVP